MRVGLTLHDKDFIWMTSLLESCRYQENRIGLVGIAHACAVSQVIDEIWLLRIFHQSSPKNETLIAERQRLGLQTRSTNKFIRRVVSAVCNRVEDTAAMCLLGHARKQFTLEDKDIKRLKARIRGSINLDQKVTGFNSFTSVTEEMESLCLDLVIRGSGLKIERGEILHKGSHHGVLSLHHGFNITNRGGPPGFWEVCFSEHSGITAQILTKELDGAVK